jgi:hypothetical protein
MDTSKAIEVNRCYDADEILDSGRTFLSYKAFPVRNPGVPDNLICEAKAYYEERCQGAGVVSDNFKNGACINSYMNPSTKKMLGGISPDPAMSFHMECCMKNEAGTACMPPTS